MTMHNTNTTGKLRHPADPGRRARAVAVIGLPLMLLTGACGNPLEASPPPTPSVAIGAPDLSTSFPQETPPTSTIQATTAPPGTEPTTTTAPPATTAPPTTAPPGTDPTSTTAPPTTEPVIEDTSVSGIVKLIRFQAVKDCDGIEGAGEFRFKTSVEASNGVRLQSASVSTQEQILDDGQYYNVLHDVPFEMDAPDDQWLKITFNAEEWDQDLFGKTWIDDRIASSVNRIHSFTPGGWTNLETGSTGLGGAYPQAIQLADGSPGSGCAAELHYLVLFD